MKHNIIATFRNRHLFVDVWWRFNLLLTFICSVESLFVAHHCQLLPASVRNQMDWNAINYLDISRTQRRRTQNTAILKSSGRNAGARQVWRKPDNPKTQNMNNAENFKTVLNSSIWSKFLQGAVVRPMPTLDSKMLARQRTSNRWAKQHASKIDFRYFLFIYTHSFTHSLVWSWEYWILGTK